MRGSTIPSPRAIPAGRRTILVAALGLAFAVAVSSAGCGTESVGVDACRKIEKVRCESAAACGIDLRRPVHSGSTPESDVAACIRYYDDQCLHGVVLKTEPDPKDVDACVDAIIKGDCSIVERPETHSACKFLVPPPSTPADSGVDADSGSAADAASD
ncbi:MAG TPA: hypothetical protein VM925_09640 [Labilithrix sp.]|nr:hypothetical protein [Labilithrix sp.]